MRTHLKLKKHVAWKTFWSALKVHPSSTSFVRKPQTNESRTFAEIGKSTNPNTRSSQQKTISFRRRIMWKTTALRMWNTTIDFMKSYMNPLESSCMLHRTGWIRNSKRTESTKLTKQTDSSAVALLVPISLAFFVVLLCFSFISNFDESFVSSSLAQKAWPFMQAIDLVYTIHKELQNHANVLQIYL